MAFVFNIGSVKHSLCIKNICKVFVHRPGIQFNRCPGDTQHAFKRVNELFGVHQTARYGTLLSSKNSGKTLKHAALCWWSRNLVSSSLRQNAKNLISRCMVPNTRYNLKWIRTDSGGKTSGVTTQNVTKAVIKTKASPDLSNFRRLLSLAKPEKWKLLAAVGFLFVSSAVTLVVPFGIGHVIDIIYTTSKDGNMSERLQNFCLILLSLFILGAMANFSRIYLMQSSGNRIVRRLREQLFSSIIRQDVAFFDKNKTGELINRLSSDTSLIGQSLTMNISDGLRSVVQALGGVSWMVYTSPQLAAVSLCIVPPVALVSRFYGRYVQKITKDVQSSLADATQVAEERLGNIRTVRAFVQEQKESDAYNSKIDHVLNLSYKESLARGLFWAMTGFSGNVIVLSVFYYGGMMMSDAQITVGELSSFLLYAAFVGVSIGGMSTFYTELMRGLGASSRLWELTDRKPSIPLTEGLIPTTPIVGNIEFRDICFSYPTRQEVLLFDGLNLSIPRGSVTAVVGSSGSGKSTLASLLLRFYEPSKGAVHLDGNDIKDLSPHWLRSHIGVVSQEPILFSTTIAENISYGSLDPQSVSTEQIMNAARMANADVFIRQFPKGLDTLVGERGVMLSGGQKQRIAIARAILKNPKILLLDEATSALDAESEYLVQEALERVMVGRTVLVIAHRLSTIKNADQIAVLDNGKVVEVGSYDRLTSISDGIFRKLVERQTISA